MQKLPSPLLANMFVFVENVINQKGPIPDADKSGIDIPFHVSCEVKTIPDSRLFSFWYLFYDEDSTKAVTFDTKKKEFSLIIFIIVKISILLSNM